MPQHTTLTRAPIPLPPLLVELWRLLAAHRPAVHQARCFDRLRALVLGHLCTAARHTLTQVLLALGLVDADWSAFYRLFSHARLDYDVLTRCFVQQTLAQIPPEEPYLAVVDGVQLPRSSQRMPGTSWLKNPRTPPFKPGIHRAQRFVHLAALLPRWQGYSRALPVRWVPAFPPKAVPGAAPPQKEWAAARAQLHWLRTALDAAGRAEQPVLALGDGSFDVVEVWTGLPERTVLLARTAGNRALYELPSPGSHRNRRYGERAKRPEAWLRARDGWQHTTVCVRGRLIPLRYRVEGPSLRKGAPGQPLFLLVVKGIDQARGRHRRRRKPAFWLVNAVSWDGQWGLPYPAEELLAWAWQRWEVEVAHREMKTDFGVGEVQCWHSLATVRAVQQQVWAYAVCVLAGYRAWGYDGHPAALRPRGVWWRGAARWSLATLWRGYRQALGQQADFHPARAGTRGTWAEKDAWLHRLDALIAAAVPM
jgi:DDE superfamily endonuclease